MRTKLFCACLLCFVLSASGCANRPNRFRGAAETGGDPTRGVAAITRYGCGSCHTVPGVDGAHGKVGPPLTGIGARLYVAGELVNTPDNLMHWISHPTQVNEKTVMPDLGVTPPDSKDIAAYLYSLE